MLLFKNSFHILIFSGCFLSLNPSTTSNPLHIYKSSTSSKYSSHSSLSSQSRTSSNRSFENIILEYDEQKPSETAQTTLNCTTELQCLPHSVCYHNRCRCKIGYKWVHAKRECIPKSCMNNFECYNLYGNTMCNGDGCVCNFGFEVEPLSQECQFRGFVNPNTVVFFMILISIVVLLWVMLPGFIILLKHTRRRRKAQKAFARKRLKEESLKTSIKSQTSTRSDQFTQTICDSCNNNSDMPTAPSDVEDESSSSQTSSSVPASPLSLNNETPSFHQTSANKTCVVVEVTPTPNNTPVQTDSEECGGGGTCPMDGTDTEVSQSDLGDDLVTPPETPTPDTTISNNNNPFGNQISHVASDSAEQRDECLKVVIESERMQNAAQIEAENMLFEISRDLLHEAMVLNSNSNSNAVKSFGLDYANENSTLVNPGTSSVENTSTKPAQNSRTNNAFPNPAINRLISQNSNQSINTSLNSSTNSYSSVISVANLSRLNSQISTTATSTNQNFRSVEALYCPPPPYTPPSSPALGMVRSNRVQQSQPAFQSELLDGVPIDLLSYLNDDTILSSSPITSSVTIPPPRLTRQNSNRPKNSSSNNLVALAGPIVEEEDHHDNDDDHEVIAGPICQAPPPYFKRADNNLDTKDLPEPCTSRAAVTRIIEEEKRQQHEELARQASLESMEASDESSGSTSFVFDYTRSLNRNKVALI